MSGFYLTVSTDDGEEQWNSAMFPAVPAKDEIIRLTEPNGEVRRFRVLRREWLWQERTQTANATIYVEPIY